MTFPVPKLVSFDDIVLGFRDLFLDSWPGMKGFGGGWAPDFSHFSLVSWPFRMRSRQVFSFPHSPGASRRREPQLMWIKVST